MKAKKKLLSVLMSLVLAAGMCPASALAYGGDSLQTTDPAVLTAQGDGDVAEGTWGTCRWEIDSQGTLTVHPGTGEDTTYWTSPWADYADSIKRIVFAEENGAKVVAPEESSDLFMKLSKAESIDVAGLDTSSVTGMSRIFCDCSSLTSLDLSSFDTSSVMYMGSMFSGCSSLTSLDLSSFDTSKATTMNAMFLNCSSLKTIFVGDSWSTESLSRKK